MMLYNPGATLILGAFGIGSRPVGAALWPAVVLHAAMTAWCIMSLRGLTRAEEPENSRQ